MINVSQNFLDQSLIDSVLGYYEEAKGKPLFEVNEMGRWHKGLYEGNFGPVYVMRFPDHIQEQIVAKTKTISDSSDYEFGTTFLHIWQPGSGINWHMDSVDGMERIGMTIYLNKEWSVNWGGIFLWEKDGTTGWIKPQYNCAVWFKSPLWHSVSLITRAAIEPRISIQIFLNKKQ